MAFWHTRFLGEGWLTAEGRSPRHVAAGRVLAAVAQVKGNTFRVRIHKEDG